MFNPRLGPIFFFLALGSVYFSSSPPDFFRLGCENLDANCRDRTDDGEGGEEMC